MLEPLGVKHQALTVPEQDLDQVTATAAKGEECAAERIAVELLRDQRRETLEAAAYVGRSPRSTRS